MFAIYVNFVHSQGIILYDKTDLNLHIIKERYLDNTILSKWLFNLRNLQRPERTRDNSSSVIITFCIVRALHLLVNIFGGALLISYAYLARVGVCLGRFAATRSLSSCVDRALISSLGRSGFFFLLLLLVFLGNLFIFVFVLRDISFALLVSYILFVSLFVISIDIESVECVE